MKDRNHFIAYAATALCGFFLYMAIVVATGKNEAWDDGSYYSIGIPLMCIVAFVIGYSFPAKPWRWALGMACGQMIAALLHGSSLNLWPLAMIFMAIISTPQLIAALLGSKLSRKGSSGSAASTPNKEHSR